MTVEELKEKIKKEGYVVDLYPTNGHLYIFSKDEQMIGVIDPSQVYYVRFTKNIETLDIPQSNKKSLFDLINTFVNTPMEERKVDLISMSIEKSR